MSVQEPERKATVLVVDDAHVDRLLVQGILEQDPRLRVRVATNGREALARIEAEEPDLVVTDLRMPEVNGLELVSTLRRDHASVPTILITSQGSEELAVRALAAGASSYVPKRAIATTLLDTVHEVLAAARHRRGRSRLMSCMTRCDLAFVLENDVDLVRPLVAQLQGGCTDLGLCPAADDARVGVAIEEALTNAIFHGNLELDSGLRETDADAFWRLADERRRLAPWKDRRVRVTAALSPQEAVIRVQDEGRGFDPRRLPDPRDPENLHKVSGRGILLMRAFMDEVDFGEGGSVVTLVKRRSE